MCPSRLLRGPRPSLTSSFHPTRAPVPFPNVPGSLLPCLRLCLECPETSFCPRIRPSPTSPPACPSSRPLLLHCPSLSLRLWTTCVVCSTYGCSAVSQYYKHCVCVCGGETRFSLTHLQPIAKRLAGGGCLVTPAGYREHRPQSSARRAPGGSVQKEAERAGGRRVCLGLSHRGEALFECTLGSGSGLLSRCLAAKALGTWPPPARKEAQRLCSFSELRHKGQLGPQRICREQGSGSC